MLLYRQIAAAEPYRATFLRRNSRGKKRTSLLIDVSVTTDRNSMNEESEKNIKIKRVMVEIQSPW